MRIVEDAAQCQGATRHGHAAGSRPWPALALSPPPASTPVRTSVPTATPAPRSTNSPELADLIRLIREHGSPRKYVHEVVGVNSRMDTLQAVVLSVKVLPGGLERGQAPGRGPVRRRARRTKRREQAAHA